MIAAFESAVHDRPDGPRSPMGWQQRVAFDGTLSTGEGEGDAVAFLIPNVKQRLMKQISE